MSAIEKRNPNRILIIDDDIDLLMLLERRLVQEGYDIETAASLPEAEELIPSFRPQLVLLDINVKGEDGRILCWQLKKKRNSKAGYSSYHVGLRLQHGQGPSFWSRWPASQTLKYRVPVAPGGISPAARCPTKSR